MEWIENKISRSSFVDFNITLYRINDEIYDEIIFKDEKYYLIRRCGVEPYKYKHGHSVYFTNKDILVYPLKDEDIFEQELDYKVLKSFNELSVISLIDGVYTNNKFTLDIDKRYIEYVDVYTGDDLSINTEKIDPSRTSYIYKIKNMLPHELIDNDLFVSDHSSPAQLTFKGYSHQLIDINEDGDIVSPTPKTTAQVTPNGIINRDGVYDISIYNYTNEKSFLEGYWHIVEYSHNDVNFNTPLDNLPSKKKYGEFNYPSSAFTSNVCFSGTGYITNSLCMLHVYSYILADEEYFLSVNVSWNSAASLYVNKELICASARGDNYTKLLHFHKGWNRIDILATHWNNWAFKFSLDISAQDFVHKFINQNPISTLLGKIQIPDPIYSVGTTHDTIYNSDGLWKVDYRIASYTFTSSDVWKMEYISDKLNKFIFVSDMFNITDGDINVISNNFVGVVSANNKYEISVNESGLICILPALDYPDMNAFNSFIENNDFTIYYKRKEPLTRSVINPSDLYNMNHYISKNHYNSIFYTEYETLDLMNIDYTVSVPCSYYKTPISVVPTKTYILNRNVSGNTLFIEYYDTDKNIVGYSDFFDTSATSFEITIPANVNYISIYDAVNNVENAYSLQEVDTYGIANTTISQLQLTINGETTILPLPHELNPGDELEYDIDLNRWTYYPLSIDDDFIYYDGVFDGIILKETSTTVSSQPGLYLTAAISCIDVRQLSYPTHVTVRDDVYIGDYGYGNISWDEVPGATEYAIYIDNNLVASVDNNPYGIVTYHCTSEQKGDVTIYGYNDLYTGELSDPVAICTVPNSPILESVDTVYENNRYYVTVKFTANSTIAQMYEVLYSIDGANDIVVQFEHNGIYGTPIEYTFNAPSINSNFTIQLTATNETGRNDYIDPNVLVTNSGFSVWTYRTALKQVLLGWIDEFVNEFSYSLKYSINNGDWNSVMVDGKSGSGTRLIEYLPLNPEDEMRVCIAVVKDGYVNIYTRPITVSKALDKTLLPPSNFIGTKIDTGEIQFTWDDNYDVDADFELYYQYSNGTSQTVVISKESSTTGNYTYVYNVDVYGFITAKLRMIWELGESEYTENIIVYNIPVVSEAPALLPRKRENNKLKIAWETYEFIQNYILYFTVDGVQTIIEQVDSEYYWDIPYDKLSVSITAAVKAVFIDGTYTNVSHSLSFSICNNDSLMQSVVFTHHEEPQNLYTTMYNKALQTDYLINTLTMNSYASVYRLFEKTYHAFLFTEYPFEENFWGHNIGETYPISTTIKGSFLSTYHLLEAFYNHVSTGYPIQTTVYYPTTTTYPLYSEFVKIAIACLGDSITAGHPNFWAETNTGEITSQYEYWLNRRLKDEFNVVNKGYGQEKTVDMLERFDRDILPLDPRYCIVLGGTNDYVKTYIVRCNRKLCSVCL